MTPHRVRALLLSTALASSGCSLETRSRPPGDHMAYPDITGTTTTGTTSTYSGSTGTTTTYNLDYQYRLNYCLVTDVPPEVSLDDVAIGNAECHLYTCDGGVYFAIEDLCYDCYPEHWWFDVATRMAVAYTECRDYVACEPPYWSYCLLSGVLPTGCHSPVEQPCPPGYGAYPTSPTTGTPAGLPTGPASGEPGEPGEPGQPGQPGDTADPPQRAPSVPTGCWCDSGRPSATWAAVAAALAAMTGRRRSRPG